MTAPFHDRAGDEAAHWLVALEEAPADAALRARFQAWLEASPENAAAWADTAHVYGLMAELPAARKVVPFPRRRRVLAAVLSLAVAACVAVAALPGMWLHWQADQVTAPGEIRQVRLEDGTLIHLAADSAVSVNYAAEQRQVTLLSGEAFFEVAPNPARPFRVNAGAVEITVLGTAFDVRLDDGVSVAVAHGLVRVDGADGSDRLGAGAWLRLEKDGREQGILPPSEVAPWRDGQLVARDRPMAEVIDDLRRYLPGLIVVTDPAWGQARVTGVYNTADPLAALKAVAGAHGGGVTRITPWLVLVSPG